MVLVSFRFQYLKLGIKKKKAVLSSNCTFPYFEKGSRNSSIASILLVHGLTGAKENYLALAHFLPKTYHVIALDLLGHGESLINDNDDYSVPTFVNYLKKVGFITNFICSSFWTYDFVQSSYPSSFD